MMTSVTRVRNGAHGVPGVPRRYVDLRSLFSAGSSSGRCLAPDVVGVAVDGPDARAIDLAFRLLVHRAGLVMRIDRTGTPEDRMANLAGIAAPVDDAPNGRRRR